MQTPIFALIDCNNFFCSCERVFNPKLANIPVAVLSNNDGCIIARSDEVKNLGIPIAAPYYKYKHLLERHNGKAFSANFQLYSDMSRRVMDILQTFTPEFEQYSIDEAFLKFDGYNSFEVLELALKMKEMVLKWTGLPVSIGLGPTKTLAKVANHIAKKHRDIGVFNICLKPERDKILADFSIGDIWGIGHKWKAKLMSFGILTAAHLVNADTSWMRQNFSIIGERLVRELRGMSCLDIEDLDSKKSIASTRSFGKIVTNKETLLEAISTYAARACTKLRKQNSKAGAMQIFIRTNRFQSHEEQYYGGSLYEFRSPISDTSIAIKAAALCLDKIYKPGYKYNKAGVILFNLSQNNKLQHDLFIPQEDPKREKLMQTLDKLNLRFGEDIVAFAAQGTRNPYWSVRCNNRSPRYTTNWLELPIAIA